VTIGTAEKASALEILTLEPRGSWVVLEQLTAPQRSEIKLPEKSAPKEFRVVKVGPGFYSPSGEWAPVKGLMVGDRVVFDLALIRTGAGMASQWHSEKCAVTGRTFVLVPEDAIQAVYRGEIDSGR
jgi:hypothetical protein